MDLTAEAEWLFSVDMSGAGVVCEVMEGSRHGCELRPRDTR